MTFNNILTAIIGHCDLMMMRHTPGDSDYDDIQQIKHNSNRAAGLTRQLLAFSRQQTLRPQDPAAARRDLGDHQSPQAPARRDGGAGGEAWPRAWARCGPIPGSWSR
jgi:signal transduction histidine kinase